MEDSKGDVLVARKRWNDGIIDKRETAPAKPTKESLKRGETRRRIEDIRDSISFSNLFDL